MVALATKQKTKALSWTTEGCVAFENLKALMNSGPKLYFIDYQLPIILFTDVSNYARGAYLCQLRSLIDGTTVEEPIRFLGGIFQDPKSVVYNRKRSLRNLLGTPTIG